MYPQTAFPSSFMVASEQLFSRLCHINRDIIHVSFVSNCNLNHCKQEKSFVWKMLFFRFYLKDIYRSSHKAEDINVDELIFQKHIFYKIQFHIDICEDCWISTGM